MLWNELGRAQGLQPGSPELPPQTYTQGQQGLCLIGVVSPGARRGLEVGHPEVSSPLWLGPPPTTVRIPPRTGPCRALGVTWASYLSTPSQLQSPAPGRVVGISLPEARGRARLDPCQGSQCHLHHTEVRPCPHAPGRALWRRSVLGPECVCECGGRGWQGGGERNTVCKVPVRGGRTAPEPLAGSNREQPWSSAPLQAGPAPCSSSAVFPRCPELPGLVCEGWDRIPALTALVPARQALFMLGR